MTRGRPRRSACAEPRFVLWRRQHDEAQGSTELRAVATPHGCNGLTQWNKALKSAARAGWNVAGNSDGAACPEGEGRASPPQGRRLERQIPRLRWSVMREQRVELGRTQRRRREGAGGNTWAEADADWSTRVRTVTRRKLWSYGAAVDGGQRGERPGNRSDARVGETRGRRTFTLPGEDTVACGGVGGPRRRGADP